MDSAISYLKIYFGFSFSNIFLTISRRSSSSRAKVSASFSDFLTALPKRFSGSLHSSSNSSINFFRSSAVYSRLFLNRVQFISLIGLYFSKKALFKLFLPV